MTTTTTTREVRHERAALVGLVTRRAGHADPDILLDELGGLAEAAGAAVVLRCVQDRPSPDSATLIGRGKVETLARGCAELDVSIVIVDNDLTPAQARNLEERLGRRVIDRTELILDIFARRARTREGQLQVELAQLQYRLPGLAGSGDARFEVEQERIRLELDQASEGDPRVVTELYRHGRVISHLTEEGRVTIEADVPRRLLGRFSRVKVPA